MRVRNPLLVALSTVLVASASQFSTMAVNINGVELTKPSQVDKSAWEDVVKFLKDLIGKEEIRVSIYFTKDPDLFSGVTPQCGVIDTRYCAVMLNFEVKKNEFPRDYGEGGIITLEP